MTDISSDPLIDINNRVLSTILKVVKNRFFILLLIILALILFSYKSFFVYIKPNEVALKQVNVSLLGHQGLQQKTYGPGWHLKVPLVDEFIIFINDLQIYELADFRGGTANRRNSKSDSFFYEKLSSREVMNQKAQISNWVPEDKYQRQGAANIQTNDGFYVKADISIIYRIIDPYKVAQVLGRTSKEIRQNGIAKKAESVIKDSFGKLTTEEFYNSKLRSVKAKEAKELFNQKVLSEGLQVENVLVRYFEYSDEIQKNIEEKKLKDQLVFKNQSEARAAIEGALLKKVKEEGEAALKVELQKGEAYRTRKIAEKDAYVRKKKAAGDLLVKLAQAKKTRMVNEAYKDKGSERIIGLEMAKVLEGIDLIIIPSDGVNGMNPLDLEKTMKMFESGK